MDNKELKFSGRKLYVNNLIFIETIANIKDAIKLKDEVILLLDVHDLKSERNIYCYSMDKALRWQIVLPDKIHDTNFYTSIYLSSKGELRAYNKNGVEVTINPENGDIIQKELIK